MTADTAAYTVQLANTPDGDGDYLAEVFYAGESVKPFYRETRESALAAARAWAERHAAHDPDDFDTVTL